MKLSHSLWASQKKLRGRLRGVIQSEPKVLLVESRQKIYVDAMSQKHLSSKNFEFVLLCSVEKIPYQNGSRGSGLVVFRNFDVLSMIQIDQMFAVVAHREKHGQ
jgi:hypothetical protein